MGPHHEKQWEALCKRPFSTHQEDIVHRRRLFAPNMMRSVRYCFFFLFLHWLTGVANSFTTTRGPTHHRRTLLCQAAAGNNQQDDGRLENGIDKGLLPPTINIRKESILFGDNPATRKDSNSLRAWRATKKYLPFVFTGARTPTTADDNPIAGFYNMIFVRLPTIAAGIVYSKNALTGHPLVIDVGFGSGPTEVNPLIVAMALFVILR
eukprot:scaffold8752_cov160-Amphora_coffeaeformis.AAC.4